MGGGEGKEGERRGVEGRRGGGGDSYCSHSPHYTISSSQSIVPVGGDVVPTAIFELEELERLASLQMRDRLVRGLDLPHHLTALLTPRQLAIPLPSSILPPHSDSGVVLSASEESVPPNRPVTSDTSHYTLPIDTTHPHTLPGSLIPHQRHQSTIHHPPRHQLPHKTFSAGRKILHPQIM